jgi:hypothetical protein
MPQHDIAHLPTFEGDSKLVNIVVKTSKGMRTKLKYAEKEGEFRAEKVLSFGLVFPFDFGFLPSTIGGDGDPLDALVLSETGIPFGCLVLGQPVGVLECEQTEKGEVRSLHRRAVSPRYEVFALASGESSARLHDGAGEAGEQVGAEDAVGARRTGIRGRKQKQRSPAN